MKNPRRFARRRSFKDDDRSDVRTGVRGDRLTGRVEALRTSTARAGADEVLVRVTATLRWTSQDFFADIRDKDVGHPYGAVRLLEVLDYHCKEARRRKRSVVERMRKFK